MAYARSPAALSQLIHLIYDAALHPVHWSRVVEAIASSVNAHKGMVFTPYLGPQDGGLVFPWNLSEAVLQLFATRYMADDLFSAAALETDFWQKDGSIVADELVPRAVLEQSSYYRDFLCTVDIGRMCACQISRGAAGLPATLLTVYRPPDGPPFTREDQDWLALLVPHLSRALGVMQRLDTARLHAASALTALDRLSFGAALLDEARRVIHLNDAARTAIERRDGLLLDEDGGLDALPPTRGAAGLRQWLRAIQPVDATGPTHFAESYSVARLGSPARRYALQCAPLATAGRPAWIAHGEAAHFIVFITDPDAARLPSAERLRELYGLTPAQSRVALGLAGGGSLKQTAQALGISEQTVQSHVKEIYLKLRVNRLPDLVRVLLSLGQAAL